MNYEEVYQMILNEDDGIIYLADTDTYELLFLNRGALALFGHSENCEEYKGRMCYEFLQGKDKPCSFCTNPKLTRDKFYSWEYFNPLLNKYLAVRDKLLYIEGRNVRLEIATDITHRELEKIQLTNELSIEKTLVNCIRKLTENEDFSSAINDLLKKICEFYRGDRAYIFEFDYDSNHFSNSYEWCSEGISSEIDNLQNIQINEVQSWCDAFREHGNLCISNLSETADKDSMEYHILSKQGIENVIAVPLMSHEVMLGFIGVDNPLNNINDLTLLESVTFFILNDMQKRRMLARLAILSSVDNLTGIYNRTRYNQTLNSLKVNMPSSIGIAYLDVNGLKKANDTYGHDAGDQLIKRTGDCIKKFFPDSGYRIGGDEFVLLCPEIKEKNFEQRIVSLRNSLNEGGGMIVSLGAYWTEERTNPEGLVSRADELMYLDKQRYYEAKKESVSGNKRDDKSYPAGKPAGKSAGKSRERY